MVQRIKTYFNSAWGWACLAGLLFCIAIGIGFWDVLPADCLFLAPDAPLEPLTFREAWAALDAPAPALLNLFRLFPFAFAYEGGFWLDQAVCGLAAVYLLRGYRLSWGAAWVGGFAAAFTGYFATLFCAGHRGVVDAVAVTCVAFGLVHRAISRGSVLHFVLLGALLPLGLAAQADIWLIMLLGVVAYAGFLTVQRGCAEGVRPTVKALLPGLLCALLCFGLTGIPAFQHTFGAAQETRAAQLKQATAASVSSAAEREARWRFTTDWSLPPEDCIEFLIPGARGHTSYGFDPKPYVGRMGSAHQVLRQHSIHLGWATLLLVVVAWWRKAPPEWRGMRCFWTALAVAGGLLAMGKYTPIYAAVWELPFINQIRAPVKWLHLTGFACAVLAGFGAERLVRRWGNGTAIALCVVIALTGAWVIRPFVFPIQLPHRAALRQLSPQTRVYASPTYHAFLRAHGLIPVSHPRQAQAALLLQPRARGFELLLLTPETLQ